MPKWIKIHREKSRTGGEDRWVVGSTVHDEPWDKGVSISQERVDERSGQETIERIAVNGVLQYEQKANCGQERNVAWRRACQWAEDLRKKRYVWRIMEWERMATEMIADGGTPNIYFVTLRGNVILMTTDYTTAYACWIGLAHDEDKETEFEDRQYGTLASVVPSSDQPGAPLVCVDDTAELRKG